MKNTRFLCFVCLSILIECSSIYAQALKWTKLQIPTDTTVISEPYFISENFGFMIQHVTSPGTNYKWGFYRTIDGGMHWSTVSDFDPNLTRINQVFFINPAEGYLTSLSNIAHSSKIHTGIYQTKDSGLHWKEICGGDSAAIVLSGTFVYYSVYISGGVIFAAGDGYRSGYIGGPYESFVISSKDNGNQWDTILSLPSKNFDNNHSFLFGNNDSTIFLWTFNDNEQGVLYSSLDNGKHWSSPQILDKYGTSLNPGIYCFPHTNDLLRTHANSADVPIDTTNIEHSTDFGKTWEKYARVDCSGRIAGNECEVFLCSSGEGSIDDHTNKLNPNDFGVYHSTNRGKTWEFIVGPDFSEFDDEFGKAFDYPAVRHFCMSNDGSTLYAIGYPYSQRTNDEKYSALWKYKTGGFSNSPFQFSSARIINDSLNIIIHLPIYLHRFGTSNNIDMIMHYPSTGSLKYLNGVTYNDKSIDITGSQWNGRAALHFDAADLNAAPDSLLGYVNFIWSPFEYDCAHIVFDSIQTSQTLCSLGIIPSFEGIIGSYKSCGLSGIAENKMPAIQEFLIQPNPARNAIEVQLQNFSKGEYELFDELGMSHRKGICFNNSFQIDVSKLASGNYFLRIADVGRLPITKKIVISK
jgi:photosystem II stability/assembly factor-like uncharacterized protein